MTDTETGWCDDDEWLPFGLDDEYEDAYEAGLSWAANLYYVRGIIPIGAQRGPNVR